MQVLPPIFYPKMTLGYSMHVHPEGGFLLNKTHSQHQVIPLNLSAARILGLCDGRHSNEDIISHLSGFFEASASTSIAEDVNRFLQEAADRNAIDLYRAKSPSHVKKTGSFDLYLPIHFIVELTDQCNLRCRHCYRDCSPHNQTMLPTQRLFQLFNDFKRYGVSMVELSGGEPLLHPDFLPIFVRARETFDRITVLSNGYCINERVVIEFARFPEKVVVQVDLDGANPHTHDRLRGVVGAFEKTMRAIEWLTNSGAFVKVVMNVYPKNIDQIEAVADLAHTKGVNAFGLTPILEIGRAKHIRGLDQGQYQQLAEVVKILKNKAPGFVQLSVRELHELDQSNQTHGNCGAGWQSVVLGPSGIVRPCAMLDEHILNFGNLFQTDYLKLFQAAPTSHFYTQAPPNDQACAGCTYNLFCKRCLTRPFHIVRDDAAHECNWLQDNPLKPRGPSFILP